MTSNPSSSGETVILDPDRRASALCRVLGGRRVRRGGVRYFMPSRAAEQFAALYAAGYWPVNRRGCVAFMRDPTPLGLYDALVVARAQKPLDSGEPANLD